MPRKKRVSKKPVVDVTNVTLEENTILEIGTVEEVKEVKEVVVHKATGKFEARESEGKYLLISPDGRVLESGLSIQSAQLKAHRFNK